MSLTGCARATGSALRISRLDLTVVLIFALVYLGMILGGLPGLALDRTGVALLGAIALLATRRVSPEDAWRAVDVPTISLLFGLMVVSAQLRLGGFYARITQFIATARFEPPALLGLLIGVVGALSAVLGNDIICLAVTPMLIEACAKRGLNPLPFLLALPAAANVGSAATLIGNPQNILIGQALDASFAGYLLDGGVPALFGLVVVWGVLAAGARGAWHAVIEITHPAPPPFDAYQTAKGLMVLAALMVIFLIGAWPADLVTLIAAGALLLSRRLHTRDMLGQVDWQLIVLFIGLFVVNHALAESGILADSIKWLAASGIHLEHSAWLFGATAVLSNLVSNVPAVMLLLPTATSPLAAPILALSSTLAGNLFIVGSIANIIAFESSARLGVRVSWGQHARAGVPITIFTLLIAAAWLWLRANLLAGQ